MKVVRRVWSEFGKTDIGIQFGFENDASVSILNLGDEVYAFADASSEIIDSEQLSFVELE